jgi:PIN domain nuclease of toxin-antitoxin system
VGRSAAAGGIGETLQQIEVEGRRPLRRVSHLPDHHDAPFDRLLVAQCGIERLALVSRDLAFDAYDIRRVW